MPTNYTNTKQPNKQPEPMLLQRMFLASRT